MNKADFLKLEQKYFDGSANLLEEEAYKTALKDSDSEGRNWKNEYLTGIDALRIQKLSKESEQRIWQEVDPGRDSKKRHLLIWTSGIAASLFIASLMPFQLNKQESERGTALVLNDGHSQAEVALAKAYIEQSLFKVSTGLTDGYKKVYNTSASEE